MEAPLVSFSDFSSVLLCLLLCRWSKFFFAKHTSTALWKIRVAFWLLPTAQLTLPTHHCWSHVSHSLCGPTTQVKKISRVGAFISSLSCDTTRLVKKNKPHPPSPPESLQRCLFGPECQIFLKAAINAASTPTQARRLFSPFVLL